MIKFTVKILYSFFVILAANTATAGNWLCSDGSGPDGEALCYVSNVRFFPGSPPYVRAKLHDPKRDTRCEHIRIEVGRGASSLEAVRGTEALLLVALTTGLPIKFWRVEKTDSECYVSTVIIAKPGN